MYQWLLSSRYHYLRELGLRGLQAEALEVDTSPENLSSLFFRLGSEAEREGAAILLWRVQTFWARRYVTLSSPVDVPCIAPELTRGLQRVQDETLGVQGARLLYAELPVLRWAACLVLTAHPQTDTAVTLGELLLSQPDPSESAEAAAGYAVILTALSATRSPEALRVFSEVARLRHDFSIGKMLQALALYDPSMVASWFEEAFTRSDNHPLVQSAAEQRLREEITRDAERFLNTAHQSVRALALQEMLQRDPITASDALLHALRESPQSSITPALFEALLQRRGQRVFAFLCEWLAASRDDEQRGLLAEALGRFGDRLALSCLYEAHQQVEMALIAPENPPGNTPEARFYFRELGKKKIEDRARARERIEVAIQELRRRG